MTPPPLSLYIHIPWCVRKCPYCDFNSHQADRIPEDAYVQALTRDLELDQALAQGRKLESIFFGGGTPSLFSAKAIGEILRSAEQQIGFQAGIEITLETNPGTAEYDNFLGYHDVGVNRLSFGVQSFHDHLLQRLGRIHSADEAQHAFALARKAGFDNINLDLMHGLPQQTLSEAISDLRSACALQPEHISWYQLTIEPNTVFHSAPPILPDDDTLDDINALGLEVLTHAGYAQYEISAYSQPDRQSRHNLNYWLFGDYLAIGAGAHGKISQLQGDIIRYQKTRMPKDYLAALNPRCKWTAIPKQELNLEFMMNVLRLNEGTDLDCFEQRTGLNRIQLKPHLQVLIDKGLLNDTPDRIQASALGRAFLNDTLAYFSEN